MTPALLQAIPLNYFAELKRPAMTAVDEYLGLKRAMDAYRGRKHEAADRTAQEWLSYTRFGLGRDGKTRAAALSALMHESTLAGVDPSLSEDAFGSEGAPDAYAGLRKRFLALPPKGRELFATVRDAYRAQSEEMDAIIVANVQRSMEIAAAEAQRAYLRQMQRIEASKSMTDIEKKAAIDAAAKERSAAMQRSQWADKARITRLREAFEASRLKGPYFPLARFGRYFVTVRDVDGEVLSFQKFEKAADMEKAADDMRAHVAREFPGARVDKGVLDNSEAVRQAMDPRLVAEIETILGGAKVDPAVMDTIWQRYLETMPEMSIRKRQIHRKGTAGFATDALRVFASHMFHAAHQMARLKYGVDMQEALNRAADQARASDDPVRGSTLTNEMRELIREGKTARGVELMAPKAVKDLMQAYRFANEGITNQRGATLIESDRLTAWDIGAKAIGFTSARIAETYERNRDMNAMEKKVTDDRNRIIEAWATARMHDDSDARTKAMDWIREFNARPYARGGMRITQETLMQSVQTRRTNDAKRQDGVLIQSRDLDRYIRGLMPARAFP